MVSRHSAFYSPLIATLAGGFLREEGMEASYSVLQPGQRSHLLIGSGEVDLMQSAVSSNWGPMEEGLSELPVHFAQINQRDGFFLAARRRSPRFSWKDLEGATLLADHALQPLAMLRYAAHANGVDWSRIHLVDAGSPDRMEAAFRAGGGDYVHLQGPAPQQLEKDGVGFVVASVGEAMPAVAFSSLTASRRWLETETAAVFLRAYQRGREWVDQAPAAEVAHAESSFFPGIDPDALARTIAVYQQLGCWDGPLEIQRELYEQALEVFLHSGAIRRRWPYQDVVISPSRRDAR